MHHSHPFKLKYHSLPTLLPQGWHSIFCQLINQSTNNTTYANNTRSIVYHSPRMQHHLTASTFHDSTRGTPPPPPTKKSTATRIAWRKRAMSIFLAAPLRRAMPETKSFALRSWMCCEIVFHRHPLLDPKRPTYLMSTKNVACMDNGPKQKKTECDLRCLRKEVCGWKNQPRIAGKVESFKSLRLTKSWFVWLPYRCSGKQRPIFGDRSHIQRLTFYEQFPKRTREIFHYT